MLPINKAIPVSLIINEMLSNSLKYAFPKGEAGVIGIAFKREGEQYFLTVWDNGDRASRRVHLGRDRYPWPAAGQFPGRATGRDNLVFRRDGH